MFDYSEQVEAFRDERVRLPKEFREKLFDHRDSNRDRLVFRLPKRIPGLTISYDSFKPQGSSAVKTIIQTKFVYEEYDIDDGLVLCRHELVNDEGKELTADEVRDHVLEALKDKRFVKQPNMASNAIRVYYKEDDEEKHHIDFPIYRKFINAKGDVVRELASATGWVESDPTQVNKWFNEQVESRNENIAGKGTQMRRLIQLIKRFCRSRYAWDMPNGMKLTMLVAECQPAFHNRLDLAFRRLLEELKARLEEDKVIRNLAHPDQPALTRTDSDQNVVGFLEKIEEALQKLSVLDSPDHQDTKSAREQWDWVFQSDGFLREYDAKKEKREKQARLERLASTIESGTARTSPFGVIGSVGVVNPPHLFYGCII
ncbi:MAG: hypothetical protein V4675_03500 [Verrucomicrobiota bacterium]